jgi:hypothetical protein
MGEMADYLINGDDCEVCGMPFPDPGEGYPRTCEGCKQEQRNKKGGKR